jgi:hypothetical protein
LIARAERALEAEREGDSVDPDLAYAIDIATRLVAGELTEEPLGDEPLRRAQAVIDRAADLYPAAGDHEPRPDGPPNVESLVWSIDQRAEATPEISR